MGLSVGAFDTENHLETRPKGSGTIDIYNPGQTFVLRMAADSKYKLENLLKKLLPFLLLMRLTNLPFSKTISPEFRFIILKSLIS